jgi:hypothetical protein
MEDYELTRRAVVLGAPSLIGLTGASSPRSKLIPAASLSGYDNALLTSSLYAMPPRHDCDEHGACGVNRNDVGMIEYQRDGTEAIIHGLVMKRPDWVKRGWMILDWGITRQTPDGYFKCRGGRFHSNSLFIEALARALLIQPEQQTPLRINALKAAAEWLNHNDAEGIELDAPYTHRKFVVMSALGQSSTLLRQQDLFIGAIRWANRGLSAQSSDGINPERGGYDVSYQMVGPLFAIRYLPFCPSVSLRNRLTVMTVKAVNWWTARVGSDGQIAPGASTRVGKEGVNGGPGKPINYAEAIQVLVLGSRLLKQPDWLRTAALIRPSVDRQIGRNV